MKLELGCQSCFECGRRWIEFERRLTCPSCNSSVTATPTFVSHLRRAVEVLQEEIDNSEVDADTGRTRAKLLSDSYFDAAEVVAARIGQMYRLVQEDTSEDALSRLYLSAFGFLELGLGQAALGTLARLMAGLAFRHLSLDSMRRSEDTEWLFRLLDTPGITHNPLYFKLLLRLADLTRALEWTRFLQLDGWQALLHTLAGVCTAQDSRLLAGSESLPFRAVALHHLSQARAISEEKNYLYLVPWLSRLETELFGITRQLDDSQDLYALGQQLHDRLNGHWLLSGQRDALSRHADNVSGWLGRAAWLGTGPLVGLVDLDKPSLLNDLAQVLEGVDRQYLQAVMAGQTTAFEAHGAPLSAMVSHQLERYLRWLEDARQPHAKAKDVQQVIIYGSRDGTRANA